jgi:dienelactone hydrolase
MLWRVVSQRASAIVAIKAMHDFTKYEFAGNSSTSRCVYRKGKGPAIILLHELPGMTQECVDLARRITDSGFTVYVPLLFGRPDQENSPIKTLGYVAQLCISREFNCLAKHRSSPITHWLRELCRSARDECGGPGVGVIGMCLTGGFVLSLMADDSVIAPVASQPSLPFGFTNSSKKALGVSPQDLKAAKDRANEGVPLLALRFSEDRISPPEKLMTLRQEFGDTPELIEDSTDLCWRRGKVLETIEINSKPDNPFGISRLSHAILTLEFREKGHPTNRVFQRVIEFIQEQFSRQEKSSLT